MSRATATPLLAVLLCGGLIGCLRYTSREPLPPADIHPPAAALFERRAELGGARVAPSFVRATARFIREVHRLRGLDAAAPGARIGGALSRLATAMDQIPCTRLDLDLARATQRIRQEETRAVLGANLGEEGDRPDAVRSALEAAAAALVRVGEGPYRGAPEVLERARTLQAMARSAPDAAARRPNESAYLGALEQAERVLLAMYEALASGSVSC